MSRSPVVYTANKQTAILQYMRVPESGTWHAHLTPNVPYSATSSKTLTNCSLKASRRRLRLMFSCFLSTASRMYITNSSIRSLKRKNNFKNNPQPLFCRMCGYGNVCLINCFMKLLSKKLNYLRRQLCRIIQTFNTADPNLNNASSTDSWTL